MSVSQGSTVSFSGGSLGSLVGFDVQSSSASVTDITGISNAIIGAGANSRVIRSWDCTAVDSGTVSVRLIGMPGYSRDSIGTVGVLSFSTPAGGDSFDAILLSYEVEASVGELLRGRATFLIA